MQTDYIDEQLPFSEEEFYLAFRLVEPEREAREGAAFVAQVVREANEQAERARLALAAGSQDRSETAVPTWLIGDGAFALLALLSDDLRARVDAYMRSQIEGQREQLLRNGLYRPGGMILREPTPGARGSRSAYCGVGRGMAPAGGENSRVAKTAADRGGSRGRAAALAAGGRGLNAAAGRRFHTRRASGELVPPEARRPISFSGGWTFGFSARERARAPG